MTIITLKATDQELEAVAQPKLASGDQNSVKLQVEFSDEWDGYATSAVFFTGADNTSYEVILTDGVCMIPAEVLVKSGTLYIGVRGVNAADNAVKTSTLVKYKIEEGTPTGKGTTVKPTASVYQQLLTMWSVDHSRLNQVISGNATGDEEVQDIRVGYDGTEYETAGEAVRGQVVQVKTELEESLESTKTRLDTNIEDIQTELEDARYDVDGNRYGWIGHAMRGQAAAIAAKTNALEYVIGNIPTDATTRVYLSRQLTGTHSADRYDDLQIDGIFDIYTTDENGNRRQFMTWNSSSYGSFYAPLNLDVNNVNMPLYLYFKCVGSGDDFAYSFILSAEKLEEYVYFTTKNAQIYCGSISLSYGGGGFVSVDTSGIFSNPSVTVWIDERDKTLLETVGNLAALTTDNKDSLVDAINELSNKNNKAIYVQCDGDHDELKLQEALANAAAGDVIYPVGDCVLTNENTSTVLEKNIILMISMGVTFDGKYCGSITFNNTNPSEKQVVFYIDILAKLKNITFTEENCTNETINPTLIYTSTGAEVSDCYFTEVFDANQSATEYSIYLGNYSKFLRNCIDGWYVKPSSASQYTFRALNNCMVSDNVIQSVNASADSLMGYFFSVVQSDFSNNIFKDVSVNSGRINVGLSMCQGNKFDSVVARFALGGTVSGCAFSGCRSAEGYPLFSFTTRTTINGCSFRTCTVNEGGNFADLNTGAVFDGNTVYSLSLPESGEDIVFNAAQSNIIANNTITLDNVDNTGVVIVNGMSKTVCTGNITNYSSMGRFADDCVEANNITGA